MKRSSWVLLPLLAALAACGKPQPPDTERPPEPQATQLRDAIAQPLEQAKAAAAATEQAAKAEQAAADGI